MMTQTHNMWLWQIVLAENRKMVKNVPNKLNGMKLECTTLLKISMY